VIAIRDDIYRDHPSTAPTRYETLSAAQSLAALERALHTLLALFEYPSAGAWLDAALDAIREATGIDVRMPTPGTGNTAWDAIERALDQYAAPAAGEASASAADAQQAALIRVLLPPFKAGIAEWRRLAARRSELAALLDAIPEPVLMYDDSGVLVHANPRAVELFGTSESAGAGAQLRTEAQRLAWSLAATARRSATAARPSAPASAPALREVRAGGRVFRLRGTLATGWTLGGEAGVLVTAASELVNPLTDLELRSRFGLSAREIEVARLVASGLSNQEIAERLGVSYFTARNHVERLLAKLGVGNRSRVGAVLRNETGAAA